MLQLRIGIQSASLRLPFKQAVAKAAGLGADAIEIDARSEVRPQELSQTGLRQIRKLLEDHNLRVCAVSFGTRRGYNVREDLERRVEATKQAMSMAFALGARVVVNYVGHIPPQAEGTEWELLIETLDELGRHGQHVGALLAARTGAESGQDLARLIAALPVGSIGVDFDPGGLIVNGFSPREALAVLVPHVLHVRARDGVRDLAQGRGLETALGQGAVDFAELLGMLEEQEYRGYLTIERRTSGDAAQEIAMAMKYLKNLF